MRGLGGAACDPSRTVCEGAKHCVVCELFGCTGWARKFRFQVLGAKGEPQRDQIKKNQEFQLGFTPLRPVTDEEWALLNLTLRLIADYGALGGKTVYKPSEEPGLADLDFDDFKETNGRVCVINARGGLPLKRRDTVLRVGNISVCSVQNLRDTCTGKLHGEPVQIEVERKGSTEQIKAWFGKRHHIDYGLIAFVEENCPVVPVDRKKLEDYVQPSRWRKVDHDDFAWASLENFWCVKGKYLARQNNDKSHFNQVIGRKEPKNKSQQLAVRDTANMWLAGMQQESKKVFSFKEPAEARRTFGFVKPRTVSFEDMKQRLKQVWSNFKDHEFQTGKEILQEIFKSKTKNQP